MIPMILQSYLALHHVVLTMAVSFILSLFVERPVLALLKLGQTPPEKGESMLHSGFTKRRVLIARQSPRARHVTNRLVTHFRGSRDCRHEANARPDPDHQQEKCYDKGEQKLL